MLEFQNKITQEITRVINFQQVNLSMYQFNSIIQNIIVYVNSHIRNPQYQLNYQNTTNQHLSNIKSKEQLNYVDFPSLIDNSKPLLSKIQLQMLKILIEKAIETGRKLHFILKKQSQKSIKEEEYEIIDQKDDSQDIIYHQQSQFEKKIQENRPKRLISHTNRVYEKIKHKRTALARFRQEEDPNSIGINGKKRYNIISQKKTQELYKDVEQGLLAKSQLAKKYCISMSTVIRHIKRFADKKQKIYKQTMGGAYPMTIEQQEESVQQLNSAKSAQFYIQNRFQFMKEYHKFNEQKLIFIDELRFRKKVNHRDGEHISSNNYGIYIEIHLIVAITNYKIIHWKLKHQAIKPIQYAHFVNQIHDQLKDYVFIVDNHKNHKRKDIQEIIKKNHINVQYLPPKSRQLNPITLFFHEFKTKLLPKLKDQFKFRQIIQETHKMFVEMRQDGKTYQFFKRNAHFRVLSQRKQPFPDR